MYHVLKNLGTSTVTRPSIHPSSETLPLPQFKDKEEFRKWCVDPNTDHYFYSLTEGLNPHNRVSSSNPPHKLHGFIGDYDGANLDTSDMSKVVDELNRKAKDGWTPTWVTKTYSNKLRVIWEFEKPLPVDNEVIREKLMTSLVVKTGCRSIIKNGGWDECSKNPAMNYELGTNWIEVSKDKIEVSKLEVLFFDIAKKTKGPKGKVRIPMEVIKDKVDEMFPNRWVGDFEEGARGPLFWVDDGVDRIGAVVQEGGMWSFSTRGKSFTTWAEIFGEKFVSEYRDKQVAEAIEDIWFDGSKYFVKDGDRQWSPLTKEDMAMRLRLAGFSTAPRKKGDPASEQDEIFAYIQDNRRIHGSAPFLFNFNEIVTSQGKKYINTQADLRPLQPADTGDTQYWPHLFDWFNQWMDDSKSVHYILTWLQYFYKSSLEGDPRMGHSLIIAGHADRGKSLFSTYILDLIFGKACDAGAYLMGTEKFNKELTESPVWYIDDNEGGATAADHRRFTEALKKMSATPKVTARDMYSAPVDIERRGRIVLTTNTDADSLSILPNLDGTILDKLMIVKMSSTHRPWFLNRDQREIEDTIKSELPFALAWLANDYIPPKEVTSGASGRFGINTYHHADIISLAKDLSADQREWEMLTFWWGLRASKDDWRGNVSALMGELSSYDELQVFTRQMNKNHFGRVIAKLASQNKTKLQKSLVDGVVEYNINLSR
jgi:hypothetical protein